MRLSQNLHLNHCFMTINLCVILTNVEEVLMSHNVDQQQASQAKTAEQKVEAYRADAAKLEQHRDEITKAVAPQIAAFQKTFAANNEFHAQHPNVLRNTPEYLKAEEQLLDAVAAEIKQTTGIDAPKPNDRVREVVTPAATFEANILVTASQAKTAEQKVEAYRADAAKLEQYRDEITRAVAPQIASFQKTFAANNEFHAQHPNVLRNTPEYLKAEDKLLDTVAAEIKKTTGIDAPTTNDKVHEITPGLIFETRTGLINSSRLDLYQGTISSRAEAVSKISGFSR
jgi:glycine/D-amino acid oxidase-like deaminating enzyme